MSQKDYYQILGINKNASQQEIRQAYRKLAFQYHPDKNVGDPEASEKMKEINEAYAILSDPVKHRDYDAFGAQYGDRAYEQFRQKYSSEDIFRGSDINQIFDEFARIFGFRSSDDILKQFYGHDYQTFEFRRPGLFGKGFVFYQSRGRPTYTPDQTTNSTQMPSNPLQPPGILGAWLKRFLRKNLGMQFPERGKDCINTISLSPEQANAGCEIEYLNKAGEKPRKLMVKIPAGIKGGQRLRLRGMGAPGKDGGEAGDMYLEVKIKTPFMQKIKNLFK